MAILVRNWAVVVGMGRAEALALDRALAAAEATTAARARAREESRGRQESQPSPGSIVGRAFIRASGLVTCWSGACLVTLNAHLHIHMHYLQPPTPLFLNLGPLPRQIENPTN